MPKNTTSCLDPKSSPKNKYKPHKQSQPLRIEIDGYASFTTSRTVGSRLWFTTTRIINMMLEILVRNLSILQISTVYAISIQGNHYHTVTDFPRGTRSRFFQKVNSHIAKAVKAITKQDEGPLFGRRYSAEAIDKDSHADILERVFYAALQAVNAGIVKRAIDDPGFNSFFYMIKGIPLQVIYFDRSAYNEKKRFNKNVNKAEFEYPYEIVFSRPPGFEDWPQDKFKAYMLEELTKREGKIIAARMASGKGFMPLAVLKNIELGSKPRHTKKSGRNSYRPLILSIFPAVHHKFLEKYFEIYRQYKAAAKEYMQGNHSVIFPAGTYRPPLVMA